MNYDCSAPTSSLYIHWPFCPYKCNFCPFVALAGHDQFMQQYHNALVKEVKKFIEDNQEKRTLQTIFMGGGTPSTYPNDLLLDMFGTLYNGFIIDKTAEISIEVNPGTVKQEQLAVWKSVGINRLSIGVQSLKDSVLRSLNRHQSAQDVEWLLKQASSSFDNISVDLILGLPEVSSDEWKELLKRVVTWPITHVSVYFLTVHENTPLYFKVQRNQVMLPPDDTIIELYHWTVDWLAQHGILQYELSNFARPGYESKHNTVYWERLPYKGIGLGACSFDGTMRLQNEKNLMKYITEVEQKCHSPIISSEKLTGEQVHLEKLMLGLRRSKGIARKELLSGIKQELWEQCDKKIDILIENGFLREKDSQLVLTPKGLILENEIVVQLTFD